MGTPPGELEASTISADAAGNVLLAGYANAPVDFGAGVTLPAAGQFLAKLDGNGTALWAKLLQAENPNVSFDRMTAESSGDLWGWGYQGAAHYLRRLDANGGLVWDTSPPVLDMLAPTGDGGVLVMGGYFQSFTYQGVTLTTPKNGLAILRLDKTGALKWATQMTSLLPALPEDVHLLASPVDLAAVPGGGAVLVAAVMTDSVDATNPERVIIKLNDEGAPIWVRHDSAPNDTRLRVAPDPTGGVLLATEIGDPLKFGCDGDSAYTLGVALVSLNETGNATWEMSLEGVDSVRRPLFDAAGNIVIAGEYSGTPDLGGGPLPAPPPASTGMMVARFSAKGGHLASIGFPYTPPVGGGGVLSENKYDTVALDAAGNVLLAGRYAGALTIGTTVLPTAELVDGMVVENGFIAKLAP
jgi:hypothetical protein